jgi:hypothetical protein
MTTGSLGSPAFRFGGPTAATRRRLLGAGPAVLATMILKPPRETGAAPPATPIPSPSASPTELDASCLAAARTGEQPGPGPAGTPSQLWQIAIGAGDASAPVLGGDAVFIVDNDGDVHAIDAETGHERLRVPLNGGASGMAVAGTTLLLGGDDLVALDATTGDVRWRAALATPVSAPVACGELAYVGGARGVFAVEVATGAERWRFLTGTAMGSPAASGGVVAVCSGDGDLYVLDAASGRERWSVGIGGGSPPALAGDAVVIATERGPLGERHGTLAVLDRGTGAERWQVEVPARIDGAPAVGGGRVFLGTGGALVAFDAATGAERWRFAAGNILATPALAGEVVYLAAGSGGPIDGTGMLVALDAATGDQRWRYPLPHVLVSPPVVANGVAYVSSADPYIGGQLVAVGGS